MQDWPLHVTLADVFAIHGSSDNLLRDLEKHFGSYRPVHARVIDEAWFGENKDIQVRLLDRTDELQALHEKTLETLDRHGATFNNPEYMREGFKPHSTVQKDDQLHIGDTVTFDSITLIDLFPNENPYRRRILGTVRFAKS